MKTEYCRIAHIPAVICGAPADRAWLFVHGQGGSKEEAIDFAEAAVPAGYQVLGIDLPEHGERGGTTGFDPWTVLPELQAVMAYMQQRWPRISLRANSIGAYFSMLALAEAPLEKALFVSPVMDMERLIRDMMGWANVTEARLQAEGEIPTDFGQTLSWRYLRWVREHPVAGWHTPTFLLYGGNDALIPRSAVDAFARKHHAALTVCGSGEHWFHTPEQLSVLHSWEQELLSL